MSTRNVIERMTCKFCGDGFPGTWLQHCCSYDCVHREQRRAELRASMRALEDGVGELVREVRAFAANASENAAIVAFLRR